MKDDITTAISISDKSLGNGTVREGLRLLREYGFTYIHFSQGWTKAEPIDEATIARWQEDLIATDMAVLDVHGVHTRTVNLWEPDPVARKEALAIFEDRLRLTKSLGGDAVVYHVPTRTEPTPDIIDNLLDSLARLEDVTRTLGLKIALENHYKRQNDRVALAACFERFDADYVGLTFDSGHAVRADNMDWLLEHCFDRLTVLHLHDNEPGQDRHWLPRHPQGHVDWDAVARGIAASPYDKPLQFEVPWREKEFPRQEDYLAQAREKTRRFAADVRAYRHSIAPSS